MVDACLLLLTTTTTTMTTAIASYRLATMRSRATLGARLASAVTTVAAVVLASVLAQQVPGVDAAALTTQVKPHERSCFYAWVDKVGEKVGFYYAVQAGGSFDVDYDVVSPSDKHIISGEKERQVDIVFTGNEVGEYSFCFENDMSSFADKTVRVWKGGGGGRKKRRRVWRMGRPRC